MKKKFIAAVLAGAVMISGLSVSVMADKEKTFVYGTTGYSEEMGDAGLNPHDNYSVSQCDLYRSVVHKLIICGKPGLHLHIVIVLK